MALQTTMSHLKNMLTQIAQDLQKAENGNKAAAQRVRTTSVRLEKVAKAYRKESIQAEKNTKNPRARSAKKPAAKAKTAAKPAAKPVVKPAAKPAAKIAPKSKSKAALARPRALAFKRPTAKLPVKRSSFR